MVNTTNHDMPLQGVTLHNDMPLQAVTLHNDMPLQAVTLAMEALKLSRRVRLISTN